MRYAAEIAAAIKAKRELAGLDDSFVLEKAKKALAQEKKIRQKVESARSFKELSRSADFKELVKKVRAELRSVYGVFDKDEKKEKKELVRKLTSKPADIKLAKQVLALHQSSKERLDNYEEIYKKIFKVTGEPSSVLDLACGANPYSYSLLGCAPRYIAIDLPGEEMERIASFFKARRIKGGVLGADLVKSYAKLSTLPHADVAFLFKALDSFEAIKRNISGKILDAINATWIVVSFPTMSLGGKKHIREERRAWFEKLIARRGWHCEKFAVGDEVFYVALKRPDLLAESFYSTKTAPKAEELGQYSLQAEFDAFRKHLPSGKVLDAGCGPGRDIAMLVKCGYFVTGIDACAKMVEIAQERNLQAQLLVGDIRHLPFADALFNGIWSLASTVHFYDTDVLRALTQYWRVLKAGGVLYVGVKAGKDMLEERYGTRIFYRQHDPEAFLALVKEAGFEVLEHSVAPRYANNEGRKGEFLNVYARKPSEALVKSY